MKQVQAEYQLDQHLLDSWERLEEWVKISLVQELAKKLFDQGLVEFFEQDDGENKKLCARIYVEDNNNASIRNVLDEVL